MRQYLDLLKDIKRNGDLDFGERTGTGTKKVFGREMRFDLREGFPLMTTKSMFWMGVVSELLWMIKGETNIQPLLREGKSGVHIWDDWPFQRYLNEMGLAAKFPISLVEDCPVSELRPHGKRNVPNPEWLEKKSEFADRVRDDDVFAAKWGELGPVYGKQWRAWQMPDGTTFDQLSDVLERMKAHPSDRRLIVNSWNVAQIPEMLLPPCHCMFQFDVSDGELSCIMYQRSADTFLGVPFNIASYALLTHMIAQALGLKAREFIHYIANTHLYFNHLEPYQGARKSPVDTQLEREPLQLPKIVLNSEITSIFDFTRQDIALDGYDFKAVKSIPAPIAV